MILGAAAGNGIPSVFDCKVGFFVDTGAFLGFSEHENRYGDPQALTNQKLLTYLKESHATRRAYNNGRKITQTPGPALIELLTLLRQSLEVLAKEPLLTDTGLYQPKYQLRTYADQENLVANELSQLPNYTAKVRLLTGEHTIRTNPAPKLLSEPEVQARIRAIKERMLLQGYTTAAQAVDEAVSKRHEALRARPASDAPPPTHTNGRRNGRQKPPGRS